MRRAISGALGLAGALALCLAAAASPTPRDSRLVETTGASLVEIPVHVTVQGQPVRGLTRDDFVVLDRGRRQEIVGFEVMDLELTAPDQASTLDPRVSIAARRRFLLLFDLAYSRPSNLGRARSVIRDWVETALHPWDLVAVASYSGFSGARLELNFTSDREEVLEAVRRLEYPEVAYAGVDPLGMELGLIARDNAMADEAPATRVDMGADDSGASGEAQLMDGLNAVYYGTYNKIQRNGQRHGVTEMTRSMSALVHLMRNLGGSKQVILLSEGVDDSLLFPTEDPNEIQRQNLARERGEVWNVDTSQMFGNTPAQAGLQSMAEAFRRADCSIQAIDIGTLQNLTSATAFNARSAQSMFYLANETGGKLYRNFSDLGDAMSDVMAKTSVTYLLTFRPDRLEPDGAYHKLKVKLREGPRGAQVEHRPGYYAPEGEGTASPMERRLEAAAHIMEGKNEGSLGLEIVSMSFPGTDGRSYVPVLIEIDGTTIPRRDSTSPTVIDVYAYALDGAGAVQGFFTQRIAVDLDALDARQRRDGVKFFGDLDLPAGAYSLRVLVQEDRDGLYGTRVVPLDVAAFGDAGPTLLPPMFPDERGRWVLARERPPENESDRRPFPFMIGEEPYLPAAIPVVEDDREARLVLVGFGLGDDAPRIETTVIDGSGQVVSRNPLPLWERHRGTVPGQSVFVGTFDPSDLPTGRYALHVTATTGDGRTSNPASTPILVVHDDPTTDRIR